MNADIFKRLSLKTKMAIFILAVFLISVWSLTLFVSSMLRKDMQELVSAQQFSSVSILAAQINQDLTERISALEKLAGTFTPDLLRNKKLLQSILENRPILMLLFNAGVYISNAEGTGIADVPISTGRIGVKYSDRDYMSGAIKGKISISKPFIGKKLGVPIFTIAVPIFNKYRKVIGVMVGVTDLGKPNFLDKVTYTTYGKTGGYLLIAPKHHLIVTSNDKSRIMKPIPEQGSNPLFDRYNQGYEGSGFIIDPFGREMLSSAKQIPVGNWLLIAQLPTEEAFAPIQNTRNRMLIAAILLTFVVSGLTSWVMRRQLDPAFSAIREITSLSETANPIQYLPVERQDEIGKLVASFNHLLEILAQREANLKESEEKFTKLFQSAPVLISLTDVETGEYIDLNEEALRVSGFTREEFIGHTSAELGWITAEQRALLVDKARSDGRIEGMEMVFHAKDGRTVVGLVKGEIIKLAERAYLLATAVDITKRKRAEEDVEKLLEVVTSERTKLATLVDSIKDEIWFADSDGKFSLANPAALQEFGLAEADELDIKKFAASLEVYRPDGSPRPVEEAPPLRALKGETVKNQEEIVRTRAGGDLRYRHVSSSPVFDTGNNIIGSVSVVRDITEQRKREEDNKLQAEKLQQADRMESLGRVAGGVAHDLNNILGVQVGFSELLMSEIDEKHPLYEDLKTIVESGQQAAEIVQDLLTMARKMVVEKIPVNLNEVVTRYLSSAVFKKLTKDHANIKVKTGLEERLMLMQGSGVHLDKIMMNMVINAVEAMPDGGTLTIRTENIYLDHELQAAEEIPEGEYVLLTFSDTGVGIDERHLKHIFEPFYTTKKLRRGGLGMGLSVAWGAVKEHGGYIDVETAKDNGTNFKLYFPAIHDELPEPTISPEIAPYMGHGESILVVDDVKNQLKLAYRLLSRLGYNVETVDSGEQAIEYLKAKSADLIVLDMIMEPGLDGLDTYRETIKLHPGQRAILVSGFMETERTREAQCIGAGVFVQKPFMMETMAMAVRMELDRK